MKKKYQNIEWDLLARYVSGEATASEIDKILGWVGEDEKNNELLSKVTKDWEILGKVKEIESKDTDMAWEKFQSKLDKEEELSGSKVTQLLHNFIKAAAIIILFIGLGFSFYKLGYARLSQRTVVTAIDSPGTRIALPDGSVVFLNAGTHITYHRKFSGTERKVSLKEGEVFFQIVHNPEKPFIVLADNAEIKVLGTSFNVNIVPDINKVEVFVKTGKVQLNRKDQAQQKIYIDPGYLGILSDNKVSKEQNLDENYLSWKTKQLVFKEEKLEKVIQTINKVYHKDIRLTNHYIENCRFTSTFDNQPFESVLEVICTTFQLQVTKEYPSKLELSGEGC